MYTLEDIKTLINATDEGCDTAEIGYDPVEHRDCVWVYPPNFTVVSLMCDWELSEAQLTVYDDRRPARNHPRPGRPVSDRDGMARYITQDVRDLLYLPTAADYVRWALDYPCWDADPDAM